MGTRDEWNSYRLDDGLNIWGAPEFQGIPVFAGGLTHGDEVVDTLVANGRIATGSLAGSELDIDATYEYSQLIELRASVSDWTGVGTSFTGRYERYMVAVDSPAGWLRGSELYLANADNFDLLYMLGTMVNLMGKGNSTITLMRGSEIKMEWLATDVITDAVGLRISYMGLAAPTNTVFGLEFEKASAAGACAAKFHEIQMKEGMHIISGTASPNGVVTAPTGSLCLVTSGSGANDSLWINRGGGTVWKYVTVEA